ncbi:MAG: hypothetical protein H6531_01860 [Actinobacteria bacterium]|nr:hypothetical protein [Actinomycetota bacterium]
MIEASIAANGPEVPTADNHAKQLAEQLLDTVPIVWGAEITAAVAQRWKGRSTRTPRRLRRTGRASGGRPQRDLRVRRNGSSPLSRPSSCSASRTSTAR